MQLQIDKLGKVSLTIEEDYWSNTKDYDKLTVVEKQGTFGTYVSRKPVPAGTPLTNRKYWVPFSSLKEEIIVNYNEWVNRYGGIVTNVSVVLNSLQKLMNDVYKHLPQGIYVNGDIECIEHNTTELLTLSFGTNNNEKADFKVYINNVLYETYSTISKVLEIPITTTTEVRVESVQNNYKYIGNWSVIDLYPSYIGGEATYNEVLGHDIYKIPAKLSLDGNYEVTVKEDDDYIFICVPKHSFVTTVTMNGFEVPMELPYLKPLSEEDVTEYKIYRSSNKYKANTYEIYIGDYHGEDKDIIEDIIYRLDNIGIIDGEDIVKNKDNILKFADKSYVSEDFSGLGRVYLRKNITGDFVVPDFNGFINTTPTIEEVGLAFTPTAILWDIQGKCFLAKYIEPGIFSTAKYYSSWINDEKYVSELQDGDVFYNTGDNTYYEYADESLSETTEPTIKNVLTQSMISKANTIYIIQYDYDLDDKTITIPENCVLQFEGGSLSNGTIQLDNTYFSGFYSGFIHNVTISGTIKDVLSTLATVAKTGSYSDLNNKPIIPAQQIQSDWEQDDTDALDFIKHKPSIPAKVSDLNNDVGYISSFTEEDPTVPSHVKSIEQSDIDNWNNKLDTAPVTSVNGQTGTVVLAIPEVRRLSPQITMTDTDNGTLTSLNISDIKDLLQAGNRVILDFTVTEWAGTYAAELTLINLSNNNYSIVGTAIGTNTIMGRVFGSNTSSNVFTLTKIS